MLILKQTNKHKLLVLMGHTTGFSFWQVGKKDVDSEG